MVLSTSTRKLAKHREQACKHPGGSVLHHAFSDRLQHRLSDLLGKQGRISLYVPKTEHGNLHPPLKGRGGTFRQGYQKSSAEIRTDPESCHYHRTHCPRDIYMVYRCGISKEKSTVYCSSQGFPHSVPTAWQTGFESPTLLLLKVVWKTVQKSQFLWMMWWLCLSGKREGSCSVCDPEHRSESLPAAYFEPRGRFSDPSCCQPRPARYPGTED